MAERFGDEGLLAGIDAALEGFPGELGFFAKNLTTGESVGHRADAVMPTASVVKVGIMAELYRQFETGEVELGRRNDVTADDWQGGTGVLNEFAPGLTPTVADLCRMMIVVSDNVATHILVRLLGKERINASFQGWELPTLELRMNTRLGGDIREYAVSSARDLGRLMELIATDSFLTPASCAAMRDHLGRQQHLEQLPRVLPFNQFASDLGAAQPVGVMNKIGNYMGVRADAAIVTAPGVSFVVVTMNEGSHDLGFSVDQDGNRLNGRLGRAVFEHWVPATIPSDG